MSTKKQMNDLFGAQPTINLPATSEYELAEDALDDDLDDDYPRALVMPSNAASPITVSNINSDVDYARRTIEHLLNRSQQLVEIAMTNANDGNARDSEVAAKAIDTAISAAERLVDLHQKIKDLNGSSQPDQPNCGTGNTFVNNNIHLTTAELLKLMLAEKEEKVVSN